MSPSETPADPARFHFATRQWLPYPPELVFAFFANPENLPRLMPRWQRARIEEALFTAPPSRPTGAPRYPGIAAGNGTRLTISIRAIPFIPARIPWEALIEDFRWNEGFCDTQVRGPFRYWHHCHTVTAAPNPAYSDQPGTTVHDDVHYELPIGPFSKLANTLIIRRQIASIFRYRQQRTEHLLALMTGRPQ